MALNNISISGRLGKDPEINYYGEDNQGRAKVRITFSVAVDRYKGKDDQGQAQKSTDWFNCEAWGPLAIRIGDHFRKGSGIVLQGNMENWRRKDENTQEEKSGWRLNVENVHFSPGGDGERRDAPPADEKKTGGGSGTKYSAAEFKKMQEEKRKQAEQQKQQSDDLFSGDEIPF